MFDRYTAVITSVLMAFIALLLGIHLLTTNSVEAQMEMPEGDENMNYQAKLTTDPVTPVAGQPITLTLDILDAVGETPIAEFDEVHTKLLHLILVSQDLTEFLHVHPEYQGDGRFVLEDLTLPIPANYIVFADFTPTGEQQQVVRLDLATQEAQDSDAHLAVSERGADDGILTFTLDVPDTLRAGEETVLTFHVADAETGESVDNLDEYLGAGGHLVIVDEGGEVYLHTHPAGHDMHGMNMVMTYGPDLEFHTEFPAPGFYKMWLQVQYRGDIHTIPFVIDVTGMTEVMPETTHEAHSHG